MRNFKPIGGPGDFQFIYDGTDDKLEFPLLCQNLNDLRLAVIGHSVPRFSQIKMFNPRPAAKSITRMLALPISGFHHLARAFRSPGK
jgi:hypothetical protein